MYFEFDRINGEKITIDCSDDGKVTYSVGSRKTKFHLADCSNYIFSSNGGTSHEIICGEDSVSQLHLIILHGEDRLAKNNDERETRRHESLDIIPDKYEEMTDTSVDVEADVLRKISADALLKAIRKLKPSEQELVYRLYLDEYTVSQSEIAQELCVSENTIKQRMKNIKAKIKKLF